MDYLIIIQMQLEDLGFCAKGDTRFVERTDFSSTGDLPIQTGGGMINCGQPNTTGGLLHVIEAVHQLRGNAGTRQVPRAKNGLVTGLGSLHYGKNLGTSSAAVLSVNEGTSA
jgi:acetyl-CoA acetyltransferase